MPTPRDRKSNSPIDSEQRRLKEQELAILREEAKLRKLLEKAPKLKEEKKRRDMEERHRLAVTTTTRTAITGVLRDSRYEDDMPQLRNRRVLRVERRKAQMRFFVLCAILGLILWVLLHYLPTA
ncbi:MAG: hypothetical protein ABI615_05535 [Chthoniobacterales bacterium]